MSKRSLFDFYHSLVNDKIILPFLDQGEPPCGPFAWEISEDMDRLADRGAGALVGGAIGDALGRAVEGCSPRGRQRIETYKSWNMAEGVPKGSITDDTQMTLWLAESLVEKKGFDPEDLIARFTNEPIRGIGIATQQFVDNIRLKNLPWQLAGVPSAGNGAAMRAAPIGIYYRNDPQSIKNAAGLQAMLTHNDPMAMASSIIMAMSVAALLHLEADDLQPWQRRKDFSMLAADLIFGMEEVGYLTRATKQPSTLAQRLGQDIPNFLNTRASSRRVQEEFLSGAYVLESLPFALYSFLCSPGNLRQVLLTSVNDSYDADTVGSMACTLCGALVGLKKMRQQLPSDFFSELEDYDRLVGVAEQLTKQDGSRKGE